MSRKKLKPFIFPISLVIIVAGFWLANAIWLYHVPDRGTFGDMFGAVNALFSGLAFAGVIYAILLQREELSLQRRELTDTRKVFEKQTQLQAKQAFESTFFQLLEQHLKITDNLEVSLNSRGRASFAKLTTKVHGHIEKLSQESDASALRLIQASYEAFYDNEQHTVGHYFRSLYNILKFVDQSDLDEKRLYTNIVRSQLSTWELTLLFYNGLSLLGWNKMKPLIEKYALLKHLPKEKLKNPTEYVGLYSDAAFE